jgi:hypothetical protein
MNWGPRLQRLRWVPGDRAAKDSAFLRILIISAGIATFEAIFGGGVHRLGHSQ